MQVWKEVSCLYLWCFTLSHGFTLQDPQHITSHDKALHWVESEWAQCFSLTSDLALWSLWILLSFPRHLIESDGCKQMLPTAFVSSLAFKAFPDLVTSECLMLCTSSGSHSRDAGRAAQGQHSSKHGSDPACRSSGICSSRWQMWLHRITDCCAWCGSAVNTRFVATAHHLDAVQLVVVAAVLTLILLAGVRAETGSRVSGTEGYEAEGVRGLRALGVRELSYKLVFLACYVAPTNPRVSLERK